MLAMSIAPPEIYIYTNPVGRITPTNTGEVIKAEGRGRDSDSVWVHASPCKIRGHIQQFPTVTQHWMVDGRHHVRIDQIPEME